MHSYYDKILLTVEFNAEICVHYLETFLYVDKLKKSIVKEKTCFRSISNPICMHLFLTNNALSFKSTKTVTTGLSDFTKLVVIVSKSNIIERKLREMQYRNYRYFDSRRFNRDLNEEFSREYVDSFG